MRELRTVAESVRKEKDLYLCTEFLSGKSLAIEKLSNHRLSRGDIAVKLNPRSTDHLKSARLDGLFDSLKGIRIILFEPEVLANLACAELKAIIVLYQLDLGAPASRYLPFSLCIWPEPCGINVAMAYSIDRVLRRRVYVRFYEFIRFVLSTLDHAGVLFVIARIALVHDLVCHHQAIVGSGTLSFLKLLSSMLEKFEVEK